MNNNELSNTKVEVPSTPELNDRDMLASTLSCAKGMVTNYSLALTEASNKDLVGKIKPLYDEVLDMHRELFEVTFSKGWYKLEKAEEIKIQQEYDELSQKLNELV